MTATRYFDDYRRQPEYQARPPKFPFRDNRDEVEDLSASPFVVSLPEAAENNEFELASPSADEASDWWLSSDGSLDGKYLWLVRPDDVMAALEYGPLRRSVTNGPIKHTNLGTGDAHCGGELWFIDSNSLFINGCSGRFPPRSEQELNALTSAFRAAGYKVCSFGWSEIGGPARVLRANDIKWE